MGENLRNFFRDAIVGICAATDTNTRKPEEVVDYAYRVAVLAERRFLEHEGQQATPAASPLTPAAAPRLPAHVPAAHPAQVQPIAGPGGTPGGVVLIAPPTAPQPARALPKLAIDSPCSQCGGLRRDPIPDTSSNPGACVYLHYPPYGQLRLPPDASATASDATG
jgi:hypothetical protein